MTDNSKHELAVAMLQQELKQLYRKCVDADQKLDLLRKNGMAKFSTLFDKDGPFNTDGRHFVDYLPEIAADLETLQQLPEGQWSHHLKAILAKVQAMHQLLEQFRQSFKKS